MGVGLGWARRAHGPTYLPLFWCALSLIFANSRLQRLCSACGPVSRSHTHTNTLFQKLRFVLASIARALLCRLYPCPQLARPLRTSIFHSVGVQLPSRYVLLCCAQRGRSVDGFFYFALVLASSCFMFLFFAMFVQAAQCSVRTRAEREFV